MDVEPLEIQSYRRAYYRKNRDKALAASKAWKKANPEKVRKSNRDSMARMRALDPKRFNDAAQRWRDKNPEKVKEIQSKWRKRNPGYWWRWRCENLANWIVKRARSGAKVAGVPFNLVEADIIIPEICPALGIKLDPGAKRTAPNSIALDRIIPRLGYVANNVRVISRRANMIKNNATADELEAIARYIRREAPG
jgi:hypothetical protein